MFSLVKYKTEKNADTIEFCPHSPHENVFVCGNYQLDESTRKKSGLLLLFAFAPSNTVELLQRIECAPVLDTKWSREKIREKTLLGIATGKSIEIYELTDSLQFVTKFQLTPTNPDLLILSLDWNRSEIVCSDSDGHVHKLALTETTDLVYANGYKSHDYECWITAFDYFNSNTFYSGGDDAVLLRHDSRSNQWVSRNREHGAGVTAIHSNPSEEHLFATGSYDAFVRFWDDRNFKEFLFKMEMPGTLWRLKWDPFESKYISAACMRGGAHVIEFDSRKIVGSLNEHESMVYGIDWSRKKRDRNSGCLIATCSFYDNLIMISMFKALCID